MPQHGFARTKLWTLMETSCGPNEGALTFRLVHDEHTLSVFPHRFEIFYVVKATNKTLNCTLKIRNLDTAPWRCQTLLHTYFKLDVLSATTVSGFNSISYHDKTQNGAVFVDSDVAHSFTGEVDRVYIAVSTDEIPDICIDLSPVDKLVISKSAELVLSVEGTHALVPVDTVLWNPWIEKSRALVDLPDTGYLSFVCVEPGIVASGVEIPVGAELTFSQELRHIYTPI